MDTPLTDAESDDARNVALDYNIAARPLAPPLVVPLEFARTLERDNETLQARVVELEKDKARLDWLLAHSNIIFDGSYIDTIEDADAVIESQQYNK